MTQEGVAAVLELNFKTIICCDCGFVFAVPATVRSKWVKARNSFYCPSCKCSQSYIGETEEQRLKKKLAAKERSRLWWENEAELARGRERLAKNRVRAEKGAKTKLKKRINNGVCPCCQRSFQNLKRHIATKHKDYIKSKSGGKGGVRV